MRLIDADALLKKKDEIYIPPEDPEETWCFGTTIEVVRIDDVKEAPTVNPEGLGPKGKWQFGGDGIVECSECEEAWDERQLHPRRYCPNCGAKMD